MYADHHAATIQQAGLGQAAHPCAKVIKARYQTIDPLRKMDSSTVILELAYEKLRELKLAREHA
jgi:hypothetical protein